MAGGNSQSHKKKAGGTDKKERPGLAQLGATARGTGRNAQRWIDGAEKRGSRCLTGAVLQGGPGPAWNLKAAAQCACRHAANPGEAAGLKSAAAAAAAAGGEGDEWDGRTARDNVTRAGRQRDINGGLETPSSDLIRSREQTAAAEGRG